MPSNVTPEHLASALVAMAENGIAPDIQEHLVKTGALSAALSVEAGAGAIQKEGHEDHIYQRFQDLFDRGRKAGGFDGETQNLIRELTNAMRDAANWRAETKIALGIEHALRKKAEASALEPAPVASEPVAF